MYYLEAKHTIFLMNCQNNLDKLLVIVLIFVGVQGLASQFPAISSFRWVFFQGKDLPLNSRCPSISTSLERNSKRHGMSRLAGNMPLKFYRDRIPCPIDIKENEKERTMLRKHLKHIAIACGIGFILLFFILLARTQPHWYVSDEKSTALLKTTDHPLPGAQLRVPFHSSTPPPFQSTMFYRTIVDNNLFRPLGWRPPRPKSPYRLIGTIIPTDGETQPQAILRVTAGNKTHTVTIGDRLDADTIVTDIQPKQVTLEKVGQRRTLKLNIAPWLK